MDSEDREARQVDRAKKIEKEQLRCGGFFFRFFSVKMCHKMGIKYGELSNKKHEDSAKMI